MPTQARGSDPVYAYKTSTIKYVILLLRPTVRQTLPCPVINHEDTLAGESPGPEEQGK